MPVDELEPVADVRRERDGSSVCQGPADLGAWCRCLRVNRRVAIAAAAGDRARGHDGRYEHPKRPASSNVHVTSMECQHAVQICMRDQARGSEHWTVRTTIINAAAASDM